MPMTKAMVATITLPGRIMNTCLDSSRTATSGPTCQGAGDLVLQQHSGTPNRPLVGQTVDDAAASGPILRERQNLLIASAAPGLQTLPAGQAPLL